MAARSARSPFAAWSSGDDPRGERHRRTPRRWWAVAAVLLLFVGLWLAWPRRGAGPRGSADRPVVVEVVDGDTIRVDLGGHQETVRLIGIDTPETKHPTRPVECFGPEAAGRAGELLPPGTPVRLERDREERDAYGRLLAYVVRQPDGLFVNLDLATSGHARALSISPNTSHRGTIAAAAEDARRQGRGLWGACPGAVPSEP